MKPLYNLLAGLALAGVVGCGKPDLSHVNQELKPIDPNTPRPQGSIVGRPGAAPVEKPATPVK